MKKELKQYIKEVILPKYEKNDWAHQIWHINKVISNSLKCAENYDVDINMVYVIACFHDLGCQISRENHEQISAEMLASDTVLKNFFTVEEIEIMKNAIIDHRASLEYTPRSIYGKIIATADRFTSIRSILKSTHSYTLEFFPDTVDNMLERSWNYINHKYGETGYAKCPLLNKEFENFLIEVEYYKNHFEELKKVFIEVDKHLRKIHHLPKIEYQKSFDKKRYHTIDSVYKETFHSKVFKISFNAGFSCPNNKSGHGCIFCSNKSGDFAGNFEDSLEIQYQTVLNEMQKKWQNGKYIAYFQAGTNTYAPLHILKEKYETVLKLSGVVGLSIATRSDAITDDVLDYLEELNKRTYLTIELGLQSIHESTLNFINRGHTLENFERMVKKLQSRNIRVVTHIINGLPNESKEEMLKTVKYLNQLNIDGIKIHMLQVLKNTPLEKLYKENPFHLLTKEEYVDIVCEQLTLLNEDIIIHRLTGDPKKEDLIGPDWVLKKFEILNEIDACLEKRNYFQGSNTK